MSTATIFKVNIFLRCLSIINDGLQKKTLAVYQDYCGGMLVGFCEQRLLNARKGLFKMFLFTDLSKAMALYVLPDNSTCWFQIPTLRSEGASPLLQQKTPVDIGGPLKVEKHVTYAASNSLANTDQALRYVT